MPSYASIATHVQIKIAEKMNYDDYELFAISSKHGKRIASLVKHEPAVDIRSIDYLGGTLLFHIDKGNYMLCKDWCELQKISNIPRFAVKTLSFYGPNCSGSLYLIEEMCAKIRFVKCETVLNHGVENSLFSKIAENFNIIQCFTRNNPEPDLFNHEKFQKIDRITMPVKGIPADSLVKLKGSNIRLEVVDRIQPRIDITANIFLKEWYRNERNIEWFDLTAQYRDGPFNEDTLFCGLPCSTIYRYESQDQKGAKIIFLKAAEKEKQQRDLSKGDAIWSINRGDKKLVVFIDMNSMRIIAQECTNIDDVIEVLG